MPSTSAFENDFTKQRDRVRLEIGDTDATDWLLTDQAIAYVGTAEKTDLAVAARCCEMISAKFARKADMTEGKLSISLSQRSKAYTAKAQQLRYLDSMGATPYIGGESVSDKQANNEDTDRVLPAMFRGMLDNPNAIDVQPGQTTQSDPFTQTG